MYHIGSTSVPSVEFAKPIIDILVVVKDIQLVDSYSPRMDEVGYEGKGENGISGRRYFQKGGNTRTHHVHVFETRSSEIQAHLNFKNFLLAHPSEAQAYGRLKQALANTYPHEHEKYQEGKQPFVCELAKKANEWATHERR
ncbi:GrpB family protein [Cytobacillus spongiae]|nr:GrpB family protein [Cytobacillus spongiae]